MRKYWSKKAAGITPYTAGEQPKIKNIIKLNTNENPYSPSPKAADVIKNFDTDRLRLYPDTDSTVLKEAVADVYGVNTKCVFCGNGSDEVLALAFQAFFDDESKLKIPAVSYSFYPVWANMFEIPFETVPMKENFEIDIESLAGGSAVFPNPNAPTGIAVPVEKIEWLVQNSKGVIVVDEAYVEFGAESAISLVKKYENLLVVRTLSKSHALAGLRVGFAVGNPNLISALKCIRDSFNSYPVDMIAANAAAAAIRDIGYTEEITVKVERTRETVSERLEELGFKVLPSKSNFVFCTHECMNAKEIMYKLREKAIIVRHFDKQGIENYLRITIGTDEQMEALCEALKEILK